MSPTTLDIHGATATVHDHVAGTPRDFDVVRRRLAEATNVMVETGVTRSNVRNLPELAQWLAGLRNKVVRWRLHWPGSTRATLALPRLGLVTPRVLHAATIARNQGLRVAVSGFPICVLGPHATYSDLSAPRSFTTACTACSARAGCAGVPQRYLEMFAGDLELRPLPR